MNTTTTTVVKDADVEKLAARVRREFPTVTPNNVPVVTRRILELSTQLWGVDGHPKPRVMDNAARIVRDVVTAVVDDASARLAAAAAAIVPALLQSASPAVAQAGL